MGEVEETSPTGQSPGSSNDEGSAGRPSDQSGAKSSQRITGGSGTVGGALESDLTNQQIGRYLIQRRLGSGGTAVVYQAYDQVRGRSVALKVLASTADEKMLLRFRREAMTSGALHHPNIVRTLQVGVAPHGDVAYIAMELVEGESLSALLDRCSYLDPDEAAALLAPIATALAHAHENEIVHRDVKPSNILLQPTGVGAKSSVHIDVLDFPAMPMLSDFGIARSLDSPELTNLGRTVGTPAYMAPEQCAGQRYIDGRADVYSLGAVFYRCVVGRQPFMGATPQILHAHVYESLTIDDEILRRLPPLAVEILSRSMAKQPDDRYATASEMAAALAEAGGYEIEVDASQSAPMPTTTMTMDNLVPSDENTSSTSVLVPGSSTARAIKAAPSTQSNTTTSSKTPIILPQYDLDGIGNYYEDADRRLNTWRWSSLALLFVGVLVGAATALFMSGAFERVFPVDDTPGDAVVITATVAAPDEQPPAVLATSPPVTDAPAVTVPESTPTDNILLGIATATPTDDQPADAQPADDNTTGVTAVPTTNVTTAPPFITLVPTEAPPATLTPTGTATSPPTDVPTSTPPWTATPTLTSLPIDTPVVPPSPTWTPPTQATSGTTTLPSTPTPEATGTEPADATPTVPATPTATLLPPTPTWTPGSQSSN